MIAGCLEWQTAGLRPPARVLAATEDYFETADAFGRWLEERCLARPAATWTRAEAFTSWKAWAEAAGEFVGNARRLVERLAAVPGVDEARVGKNRERSWIGIGPREEGCS